ncbi:hypothetical protein Bca4012_084165 [Brassica carinata]
MDSEPPPGSSEVPERVGKGVEGSGSKGKDSGRKVKVTEVKEKVTEGLEGINGVSPSSSGKKSYALIVNEVDKGVKEKEEEGNSWSLVSPDKVGRPQSFSARIQNLEVSASKFSVLSLVDKEEGEIQAEEEQVVVKDNEYDNVLEKEEIDISEEDRIEEVLLDQKDKAVVQKGGKRVQKAKAQDANPKGKKCHSGVC